MILMVFGEGDVVVEGGYIFDGVNFIIFKCRILFFYGLVRF